MEKTAEQEVENLLSALVKKLPEFQNKVFSIGGFVRDKFLNVVSKDLDIVVTEKDGAEKFAKLLKHSLVSWGEGVPSEGISTPYKLGEAYPIWHLRFNNDIVFENKIYLTAGAELDIVDSQKECFPDPESRQRITVFGTFEEDIERRDFTINMLAYDLTNDKVIDASGSGISDIKKGIIRFHPKISGDKVFSDDPLRMIRAIRFHCKYDFDVDLETLNAIKRNAERIKIISGERIRDELVKIMLLGKLHQAIQIMDKFDLLQYILPEVKALQGVEQDIYYHAEGDVYVHTLMVLDKTKSTVVSQLAALLHDIGKPSTKTVKPMPDDAPPRISFKKHENVSSDMTEVVLQRLKFDLDTIKKVRKLIEFHLKGHSANEWSGSAVRRFIRDCGDELEDILHITDCDSQSSHGKWVTNHIPELRSRIEHLSQIPIRKKTILNGNEIMTLLNMKAGKQLGEIINKLQEIEDEFAVDCCRAITREEASEKLKEIYVPQNP